MSFNQRTIFCGELRAEHVGQTVTVNGWANKVRDLGGLLFVDVRDRSGVIQVIFPENTKAEIRSETVLSVTGEIRMRDEANRNSNQLTGDVELAVTSFEILNQCGTLPFPVSDEKLMEKVNEELRVKHRYIDLRRPVMLKKMKLRAAAVKKIRNYMDDQGFTEVETPIITKSTPEGARDYLVPYRLEPGEFYALPQSPQQYKQLLMVGGIERYYQIAKCFRDESQRADRQPEFTQLDVEMSFVKQEDILSLIEGMTKSVVNELIAEFDLGIEPLGEFTVLTHAESFRLYGNDKPDLRFGLEIFDAGSIVKESEFGVFKSTIEGGGFVRGIRYPGGSSLSRKQITELEDEIKKFGAKGLANFALIEASEDVEGSRLLDNGMRIKGGISKFLSASEVSALVELSGAEVGDLLLFVADSWSVSCEALSRLRLRVGTNCGLRDPKKMAFGFVVDFPLVEWNEDEQRWDPSHHPFTSPKAEDIGFLTTDTGRVRADCYDIVCNGYEWGSGSIRIHNPELQAQIFTLIGVSEEAQQERFGHILEAFKLGAPPHGGIATGIDRLVMLLMNEENIREVIAFPKMGNGFDPMMDAPSAVDDAQWAEMGLMKSPRADKK
jgi:aspartyl-tRNA synthetase